MGVVESYKKLSSRTKSMANTGFAVFLVATFGAGLALFQINENVQTIISDEEVAEKVVIEAKSDDSAFQLVGGYRSGRVTCFFTGMEFFEDGKPLSISEERWREEDRKADVLQRFSCVIDGKEIFLSLQNLIDSDPGTVIASARTQNNELSNISVGILLFDWNQNYCAEETICLSEDLDNDSSFMIGYSGSAHKLIEPGLECELISVISFSVLDKKRVIDVQSSLAIDELVVNSLPEGCSFIAAWLTTSESYPEWYDLDLIEYINNNYPSWILFETDTHVGPEYYIPDESLFEKIGLNPSWSFDCGETPIPFSAAFGGFVTEEIDGFWETRPPRHGELNVDYYAWVEGDQDVKLEVELLDRDLTSCRTYELQLELTPQFEEYYYHSKTLVLEGVDTQKCQVVSLTSYEIRER